MVRHSAREYASKMDRAQRVDVRLRRTPRHSHLRTILEKMALERDHIMKSIASLMLATLVAFCLAVIACKAAPSRSAPEASTPTHKLILASPSDDAGDGGATCDSGATNLFTDPSNCGACGNVCAMYTAGAVGQVGPGPCISGVCPPAPGQYLCTAALGCCYTGNTTPSPNAYGSVYCGSIPFCINILQDSSNCGGCGNVCSPGLSCNNGTCG